MQCLVITNSMRSMTAAIVVGWVFVGIVAPAPAQEWELNESQFNSWVYNNSGGGDSDPDSEITLAVEALDRSCHLSPAQQEKLRLAGRGDFARFKLQVEEVRQQFAGKKYDQNEIGKIYQKIQPLTARYQAGLLGDSSLFAKVVHRTLTPEQLEEYDGTIGERHKARHAAKVRLFVAMFERSCPLKSTQRDALVDLLLTETRPAKRSSEYDWFVVLVQAAKIPDEKLKTILDEPQMKVLKQSTQQARGYEQMLKQQGILPDK